VARSARPNGLVVGPPPPLLGPHDEPIRAPGDHPRMLAQVPSVGMTSDIAADLAPTGPLRASINLGNPVLAQGTADAPTGVTVDIAHVVAERLGRPLELACFGAARESFEAMTSGRADLCFLAVEPARAAEVAFTPPYVLIEGVFAVPAGSPLRTVADVDRPGVRIGVNLGSAYDLFLTRTLRQATLVRAAGGVAAFREQGLEATAGIRQPLSAYAAAHPDVRLIDERFMQIEQAVGTTRSRRPETVAFLRDLVEELKADGTVAASLHRAGQSPDLVAPPA
jgi:polar amino acid transport system substrate-binding protein